MADKTDEARKTELFDNEQKWLATSFSTDLKAFSIVINGKAKYGLAVSKLAFIKSNNTHGRKCEPRRLTRWLKWFVRKRQS